MIPFSETVIALVNHLLDDADWARSRLATHGGMRACVKLPFLSLSVEVAHDGRLTLAHTEGIPDLTIDIPPQAALTWLTDRESAWRSTTVEGDTEFASTLSFLASNLEWDYEEDLSRLIGDVAAHRVGQGLRSAARVPRTVAEAAARSVAEYIADERREVATRLESENFVTQVDELRDAVERLDKRLERLTSRLAQRRHR